MKRAEIEEQKRTTTNLINRHTEYLKELETMTPDEDKPVAMAWYTVCFVEGVLHIDQRLDAFNWLQAKEFAMKKHDLLEGDLIMYFESPIGGLEVKQESTPF